MKKSILYYFFAVVCTVCLFTACSDDDDDDNKVLTTADIAGTYAGKMDIKNGNDEPLGPSIDQSITLTKISDTKVKLELKNFAFAGLELGNIEAECMAVFDAKDNEFDLTGTTELSLASLGGIKVPIAIDGDADGKVADIDITVTNVPALSVVKVDFKGNK